LNQFLPLIADCLLTSLDLARNACRMFVQHCIDGLVANVTRCAAHVETATATVTALVDRLGYTAAQQVARTAQEQGKTIRQVVLETELLTADAFDQAVAPDAVTQLGSRAGDSPEGHNP
jgi:aspartate ammonia-lyase